MGELDEALGAYNAAQQAERARQSDAQRRGEALVRDFVAKMTAIRTDLVAAETTRHQKVRVGRLFDKRSRYVEVKETQATVRGWLVQDEFIGGKSSPEAQVILGEDETVWISGVQGRPEFHCPGGDAIYLMRDGKVVCRDFLARLVEILGGRRI